jgi:hypothetical protein
MNQTQLHSEPSEIPGVARLQIRHVLDLMSTGSIQTLIREIAAGHIEGSKYGDNYHRRSRLRPDEFCGCFLGWAGFLEQRSVLSMADALGWPPGALTITSLESFVSLIHRGMTPESDPDSAALYLFVTEYLTERQATKEKEGR